MPHISTVIEVKYDGVYRWVTATARTDSPDSHTARSSERVDKHYDWSHVEDENGKRQPGTSRVITDDVIAAGVTAATRKADADARRDLQAVLNAR